MKKFEHTATHGYLAYWTGCCVEDTYPIPEPEEEGEGWELVSVVSVGENQGVFYWKREIL